VPRAEVRRRRTFWTTLSDRGNSLPSGSRVCGAAVGRDAVDCAPCPGCASLYALLAVTRHYVHLVGEQVHAAVATLAEPPRRLTSG